MPPNDETPPGPPEPDDTTARLRVVVADDNALLREGIASLLEEAGHEVVGRAVDADDLLLKVRSYSPDVAIVDVRMPPRNLDDGLVAAVEIRRTKPEVGVLVLSQHLEPSYMLELVGENASGVGYLLKDRVSNVAEFLDAVRRVAGGGTAMDPDVIGQLLARNTRDEPIGRLTPRESEVLGLMAEGRSNAAIASALFVTEKAVSKHTNNIFAKLDLPPSEDDNRRVIAVLTYLSSR